jgi:hypothetical protein
MPAICQDSASLQVPHLVPPTTYIGPVSPAAGSSVARIGGQQHEPAGDAVPDRDPAPRGSVTVLDLGVVAVSPSRVNHR